MANAPKPAADRRPAPVPRGNAQHDHEGSAHAPGDFDALNPAKQVDPPTGGGGKGQGQPRRREACR